MFWHLQLKISISNAIIIIIISYWFFNIKEGPQTAAKLCFLKRYSQNSREMKSSWLQGQSLKAKRRSRIFHDWMIFYWISRRKFHFGVLDNLNLKLRSTVLFLQTITRSRTLCRQKLGSINSRYNNALAVVTVGPFDICYTIEILEVKYIELRM